MCAMRPGHINTASRLTHLIDVFHWIGYVTISWNTFRLLQTCKLWQKKTELNGIGPAYCAENSNHWCSCTQSERWEVMPWLSSDQKLWIMIAMPTVWIFSEIEFRSVCDTTAIDWKLLLHSSANFASCHSVNGWHESINNI